MKRPGLGVAGLALLVLATPATADAAKPGLYLKRVKHPQYEVRPEQVVVTPTIALLGKSSAREIRVKLSLTLVGARQPADTDQVTLSKFTPRDPNPLSFDMDVDVPIGRYKVKVCVKYEIGSRRVTSCRDGKKVSVIPPVWDGDVTATAPLHNRAGGSAIQGSSARATFTFAGPAGNELAYRASNPVRFYVEGTDPEGCVWSGSTAFTATGDKLLLSMDLLGYRFSPQTAFISFPAMGDCMPPNQDIQTTLFSGPWLPGFPQTKRHSTDRTLSGTNPVIPGLPGDFVWSLQAHE
jgi:hypothetical protein